MLSFFKTKPKLIGESSDTNTYRADFPLLQNNPTLIYMDSACVSLRPQKVIDSISSYYTQYGACAGRSNHALSRKLTIALALARKSVASFIGASNSDDIIFTKNATEAINLVANGIAFEKGDIVLISHKEHNSNLIPWLKLAKDKKIEVRIISCAKDDSFSADNLKFEFIRAQKEKKKVRLVSVHHYSNVDGTFTQPKLVAKIAHEFGALVLIDGCQAVGHEVVDVKSMDVDFYAFSAHKMCGPQGMGALYAHERVQTNELSQFIVGGQTVVSSTYTSFEPQVGPSKFEAGLQDYAGIIGFGAACDYLKKIGVKKIAAHTLALNEQLTELLIDEIDSGKINLIGPRDAKMRGSIFSFSVKGMAPTEFASLLDKTYNIAVRAGQHCVHSWFNSQKDQMKLGSVRVSLHFYNAADEVNKIANAIKSLLELVK